MNRRGFTLLEVLVATAIMGIAVVGLLSALSRAVSNAARLTTYDRAARIARSQMDALLLTPEIPRLIAFEQPIEPERLGGATGGWRARLTPFEGPPASAPGSPILERLELEVWWMSGAQRRSLKLEGYRQGLLKPEDAALPFALDMPEGEMVQP
jgi:general secretion pathway protein I